jgi:hypothetical protein
LQVCSFPGFNPTSVCALQEQEPRCSNVGILCDRFVDAKRWILQNKRKVLVGPQGFEPRTKGL